MYRTGFPDINWLKAEIAKRFDNTGNTGWPSTILHVKSGEAHRPDILGPLSLFLNIKGSSVCRSQSHPSVRVDEGYYFLSNRQELYSLDIEQGAETFNIHMGEGLVNTLLRDYSLSSARLLDNNTTAGPVDFFSRLYRKEGAVQKQINRIYTQRHLLNTNPLLMDELLADLLFALLDEHRNLAAQVQNIPAANAATRNELYRRVYWAYDYMLTNYSENISLDTLARVACLSRFHFLRLFRSVLGCSPHQMLLRIRLQNAHDMLRQTRTPVGQIALQTGFENQSSFNRAFTRLYGHAPLVSRLVVAV